MRSLHGNFGFEPRNIMLVNTLLDMAGYRADQVPAVQKRMLETMKTIPGVTSVAIAEWPPLAVGDLPDALVFRDDTGDLTPANAAAKPASIAISPEYFHTAGTSLLSGRAFTWNDDKTAPRVAVVNQEFERKMFGAAGSAIGRYFKLRDGTRIQVVGVAEDGKYQNLTEEATPAMFLPILQSPASDTWLVVRSDADPQELAAAVRGKLRDIDSGLPSFIQTWPDAMGLALFPARIATASLGILGLMGAMLSVTGIFGMAAYSVSKRMKELGIRMALGAQSRQVLRAALARPFRVLAFGSAAGLILGLLASRVLAFIVYQATPRDPLVLAGAVLAMLSLGLLATWIPAQRALSVDPVMLLREE
jgi:predicted permease